MQDVTDAAFWRVLARYGAPDYFVTEYLRVYPGSILDKNIVRDIVENGTGRVVVQIAGEDVPSLVRIATGLQRLPVAGIDLNLGCPAQVVCRKHVGGALLKDLPKVAVILDALRQVVTIPLSVKCRLGYADASSFGELLSLFAQYKVDWVTVHGRTVKQGYSGKADWDAIRWAASQLRCPVVGNGDLSEPKQVAQILRDSALRGLMIGRGAVRNPWIFTQIRQVQAGEEPVLPTGRMVWHYLEELREMTAEIGRSRGERSHVERLKKFLNFVGEGVSAEFLYRMRRSSNWQEMEAVWQSALDHDCPMPLVAD